MSSRLVLVACVAVLAIAVAGVAVAASGGGSGDVTLCAAKKDGVLSLAANGKCPQATRKIVISKQGQAGPAGPAGPAGTPGQPGASGAPGQTGQPGSDANVVTEALHLVAAATANCAANPGSFCEEGGGSWVNKSTGGPAPVGFQKDAGGFVHLQGTAVIAGGPGHPEKVFYLPPGFRPSARRFLPIVACATTEGTVPGHIVIESSGSIEYETSKSTCLSLDGVDFHP